jgi:histidine kinase
MESNTNNRPPHSSPWYWLCQFTGWGGFVTYVLIFYVVFARPRLVGEIVEIVLIAGVLPIAMTHGLRRWMCTHRWAGLGTWRQRVRQFTATLLLAVVCTFSIGVVAGVRAGRVWVLTDGIWWTLFAYVVAFVAWLIAYEWAHAHRSRQQLEIVAREAQLRALRAQLNPHFLFNSLNSVRSLITENPPEAANMVTGLADILRYSLASDRHDTVPLADEIAIVDEYVGLERARLEDRLRVERIVDPAALTARVPPMLVQALVENAVKHGIAPLPRGGLVRLEARLVDGRVEIVVTNPGRFAPAGGGGGFGLRNARERLRLLYGEQASLMIRDDGDQTKAVLRLPILPPVPHLRVVIEKTA